MCSTLRSSYRPGQRPYHIVNISSSYSLMLDDASEYYKQVQKELIKRRKRIIEKEKTRLENAE